MPALRKRIPGHSPRPFAPDQFDPLARLDPAPAPSLAVHAANRLMFGPAFGDDVRIVSMGYEAFVEEQLAPELIDDAQCDARLAALPNDTFSESRAQLYDRRGMTYSEAIKPITETRWATWTSRVFSKRQLFERMVEFWHDHFNIYGWDYIIRSMWVDWDRLVRQNALGNFRAFIELTARHPCMLYYLDNYISTNAGPNENYARELFELHCLGAENYQVPGGYIDQDVYEASRCFTGWTFERDSESPGRGDFLYNHDEHDRFIKFVLGTMIAGDQEPLRDARDVLDLLFNHPGTAHYLARKLALKFVSDDPSEALIQSTADVYMATRSEPDQIKRMLRHLLRSDEFKQSAMLKFKRPSEWVASAMRRLAMSFPTSSTFNSIYDALGQSMFSWRTPDGAPATAPYWMTSNGMLQRWNWAFTIASEWYVSSGIEIPMAGLPPAGVETPRQIGEFVIARIISRVASSETHDAVIRFIADGRSWDLPLTSEERATKTRFALALAIMTPEFMVH